MTHHGASRAILTRQYLSAMYVSQIAVFVGVVGVIDSCKVVDGHALLCDFVTCIENISRHICETQWGIFTVDFLSSFFLGAKHFHGIEVN